MNRKNFLFFNEIFTNKIFSFLFNEKKFWKNHDTQPNNHPNLFTSNCISLTTLHPYLFSSLNKKCTNFLQLSTTKGLVDKRLFFQENHLASVPVYRAHK